MSPRLGSFPFCNAPASILAGSPGTSYPTGVLATVLQDAYLNAKVFKVSVDAVQDGFGGNGGLGGFVYTHRKLKDGCNGFEHVSNTRVANWLSDIRLDFLDVIRKNRSATTSLYYPKLEVTFLADNVRLSSKTEAMEVGSIDFLGFGIITLFANADMIVFGGGVTIVERYDQIDFAPRTGPPGTSVLITGATFTGTTAVRFGSAEATVFAVDPSDARKLRATVPAGATLGPISIDQDEDKYSTRHFFLPS